MATPANFEDFAVGFTLSEGLVARADEIREVEVTLGADAVDVRVTVAWERFTELLHRRRNLTGRTGCGLCGAETAEDAIRDVPQVAEGFQMLAGSIGPSHAYVHVEDFGIPVTIHGMAVNSGDLIHADRHGAVVVPTEKIDAMPAALDGLAKQEARIISAARAPAATVETIKAAFRG